jgi:ATP-binding cassette subfamily F protein uup
VQRADDLRIVVFDQMREALPQDVPLRRALAGQAEAVEFGGRKIHITAWAKRFLFRQDQMDMPVKELSGGEQARIQIARLMLKPADLLVLDEPTNDLDIGSLDVLEESLLEFPGAIVLVTHDRFMLDRVSTEIFGLDGDGRVGKYTSAAHWQEAQARLTSASPTTPKSAAASRIPPESGSGRSSEGKPFKPADGKISKAKSKVERTGLTASEAKELKEMEATIQEADERAAECEKAVADPSVAGDLTEVQKRWAALESARAHVQALYARWEELESKAK